MTMNEAKLLRKLEAAEAELKKAMGMKASKQVNMALGYALDDVTWCRIEVQQNK